MQWLLTICLTVCTTAATSMAEAREHERREMQAGAYSYGDVPESIGNPFVLSCIPDNYFTKLEAQR